MSYWSKLSMKDRADVMKLFLDKGISDLDTMRREYNIFAEGGDKWTIQDESNYRAWRDSLPDNLKYTNDNDYDMRGAFKAGMIPTLEQDGYYHLQSRDPKTGRILKAPHHPTYLQAINTDARMGYYPQVDKKGNTYTSTWKGNMFAGGGDTNYSYTKPLNNVFLDDEGNLLDPEVPSAKGTIRTPEVIVTARNPRKPVNSYDAPQTFAGRVAQVAGASPRAIRETDVVSSVLQMTPYGYIASALDLGRDMNRVYHGEEGAWKDAGLDILGMIPGVSKLGMKKIKPKTWIDKMKQGYDELLQPAREGVNSAINVLKALDFTDDTWGANKTSDAKQTRRKKY